MSRLSKLKDCLTQLAYTQEQLARKLLDIDKDFLKNHFKMCNTEKNELNLQYLRPMRAMSYHEQSGALKENDSWIHTDDLQCNLLCVIGSGLGYSFLKLRKWLDSNPDFQLIYIEPQLSVLFYLFQTDLGYKMAFHPRVHFYHFKNKFDLPVLLNHLSCQFSNYKLSVIASPFYERHYPHICENISQQLPSLIQDLSSILKEGEHSYHSIFANSTRLVTNLNHHCNASSLADQFENVPCIIVGAGPSLQKNLEVLKTLKQKAIILAGSSAISGLTQQGIEPHLGNYFDPYLRVFNRFMTNTSFELPTFFSGRTFFEVARWVHGLSVYVKGSQTTPFLFWLENELGFKGLQDPQLISVTTSNTFLAQMMGCSPIIYVGVDLAYTQNQNYMQGVATEPTKEKDQEEQKQHDYVYNEEQMSYDIDNNPIKTRYGWLIESQIIAQLASQTPQIQFYNCTEGGLGFANIANLPLQKVADWFLKQERPIEEMVHSALVQTKVNNSGIRKKSSAMLKELSASLKRCSKYYKEAIKTLKTYESENQKKRLEKIDTSFLFNCMENVGQEIGYQYLLKRYHQHTDIPKLKNRFLTKHLSANSSPILENEIKIKDMLTRFEDYHHFARHLEMILNESLNSLKEDPW